MILIGLMSATALYVLLLKTPPSLRSKLLGLDLYLDTGVTALLMIMFAGTLGGMIAAVFGGLIFSGMLWISKVLFGYDKPMIHRGRAAQGTAMVLKTRFVWVAIPPIWRRK